MFLQKRVYDTCRVECGFKRTISKSFRKMILPLIDPLYIESE